VVAADAYHRGLWKGRAPRRFEKLFEA